MTATLPACRLISRANAVLRLVNSRPAARIAPSLLPDPEPAMTIDLMPGHNLPLQRYPQDSDPTLQAWDAADEYLLNELATSDLADGPLLIFNDSFGALGCALHGRQPVSISDSWLAQEACRRNLAANALPGDAVTLLDSLAPLPAAPALVIIKIPKTLALLEQQLLALREVVTPQTRILGAARVKDIHTSTLNLFERLLGPTTTSLAVKKARLIHCTPTCPGTPQNPYPTCWPLAGTDWLIHNHANVFSRGSLDIGARFFLEYLPQARSGDIADLGCGNGVIGLAALAANPQATLHFFDESHMALASSRQNVQHNRPQDLARCHFHLGNSLQAVADASLDLVLCNPPFHQQHALTDQLAWQMFTDARRCLRTGGELLIIGNRHLGYHVRLPRLFSRVETVAANQKFVILRAINS